MSDAGTTIAEHHTAKEVTGGKDGRLLRFWTTIPGILTALAAMVSAAVPGYLALRDDGGGGQREPQIPIMLLDVQPGRVEQVRARGLGLDDPLVACSQGNVDACAHVLDVLAEECSDGDGLSCDVIYEVSDADSELEWFGATCGYRFDTDLYADACEGRI